LNCDETTATKPGITPPQLDAIYWWNGKLTMMVQEFHHGKTVFSLGLPGLVGHQEAWAVHQALPSAGERQQGS
jgi:hypothetical protein